MYCLLMLILTSSASVLAQKASPINPADKKEIGELIIQLRAAPGNSYLFDILHGPINLNDGIKDNPATMLPKGFASKEDAFKVAEWMIKQYKKHGHLPPGVPPHVLDELKIAKNKLYQIN